MPLALDETASAPARSRTVSADAVCLKIAAAAGSPGCSRRPRRARAAGYEVYLASTLDGPLGIAAALHAAAVVRPDRACGLATLGLFADREDPLPAPRRPDGVPAGAGPGRRARALVPGDLIALM